MSHSEYETLIKEADIVGLEVSVYICWWVPTSSTAIRIPSDVDTLIRLMLEIVYPDIKLQAYRWAVRDDSY